MSRRAIPAMRPPGTSRSRWPSWSGSWRRIGPPAVWRPAGGRLALLQARSASRIPDPTCCREGRYHHAPACCRTAGLGHQDHARPRSRAGSSARATASKKTLRASEQERSDVRQAREHWHTKRQPRMRQEPHRLVFLDETHTSTKMTRLRGRCPKGQRLYARAPFGHWLTQTFVAGLRYHGSDRPLGDRWADDPPYLRDLCGDPARPDLGQGGCGDPRQPAGAQE